MLNHFYLEIYYSCLTDDSKQDVSGFHGQCNKDASAAAHLYRERFPNMRTPAKAIFKNLE